MLGCHQIDVSSFSHKTRAKGEASGIAPLLNATSLGGQHRLGTAVACIFSAVLWETIGQKPREEYRSLSTVES